MFLGLRLISIDIDSLREKGLRVSKVPRVSSVSKVSWFQGFKVSRLSKFI